MVEKSLKELRSKSSTGTPSKQPYDPTPPSPTFKIPEPTCPVKKTEPSASGKDKMIMVRNEDFVDRILNLNIGKRMAWTGAIEIGNEFHGNLTDFIVGYISIPPPNL